MATREGGIFYHSRLPRKKQDGTSVANKKDFWSEKCLIFQHTKPQYTPSPKHIPSGRLWSVAHTHTPRFRNATSSLTQAMEVISLQNSTTGILLFVNCTYSKISSSYEFFTPIYTHNHLLCSLWVLYPILKNCDSYKVQYFCSYFSSETPDWGRMALWHWDAFRFNVDARHSTLSQLTVMFRIFTGFFFFFLSTFLRLFP